MMNIKVSRKWWFSIAATLGMLILLWAIGTAMAQGPGPEGDVQPQGDVSAAATLNSRISYQGVLEEDGSPVTGTRNMVFNFYTNSDCSGVPPQSVPKNNEPVTNGLFSVELDVTHSGFWGQGLWLEVEVEGSPVSCQEILPVPYALSLRPGAEIEGEPTAWEGWVLKVTMDGFYPLGKAVLGSTATGSAVYGNSSGGYGVHGYSEDGYAVSGHDGGSTQAKGYGGYFTSDNGVGVYGYSGADRTVGNNYAPGVYGRSANGVGVYGIGEAWGVYGSSGDGQGVYGISVNDDGVYGRGENGGSGVYGYSNVGYPHAGVRGVSGDTGMGVYGAGKWPVVGDATSGGTTAGYFYDDVYVEGKLTAVGGVDPLILEGFAADPDRAYEVGDVLCLDEASPYVVPCSQANDTRVVGMVGPNVEIENGELLVVIMGHQGPEPLAGPLETSGDAAAQASLPSRPVVRVKADASYSPIQRGDLLTSSPTSGYAMKAQPVDVGGIEIHRPGTIIGKALEPLTEGQGLIKVFIILQ